MPNKRGFKTERDRKVERRQDHKSPSWAQVGDKILRRVKTVTHPQEKGQRVVAN